MEENDKENEEMLIRCLSCGVQNKLKALMLQQSPKCGKCGAVLIEMREFGKSSE